MTLMTTATKIERNEKRYLPGALGDGYVLMDTQTGGYITLNLTAAKIWEMTETAQAVGDIIEALMAAFNVDKALCTADTTECLSRMVENEVLLKAD